MSSTEIEVTHDVDDSRHGELFLDANENPLIIDGDYTSGRDGEAEITHYHWSHLTDIGSTTEAKTTMPEDEDTRWMSVETFEKRRRDGELRPATVVPGERYHCEACGYTWAYGGDADRPTCPNCRGKRVSPVAQD